MRILSRLKDTEIGGRSNCHFFIFSIFLAFVNASVDSVELELSKGNQCQPDLKTLSENFQNFKEQTKLWAEQTTKWQRSVIEMYVCT